MPAAIFGDTELGEFTLGDDGAGGPIVELERPSRASCSVVALSIVAVSVS